MTEALAREHKEYALRLMQIASSVAAQLDLDPLLQQIVDAAADLVGAELGGILVLDRDDATRYELLRVHGWHAASDLPQPQGRGILSLPHKEGRPLRLTRVDGHPASVGVPVGHPAIGPFLGVPLRFRKQVLGSLFVGQHPGQPSFTADDEQLLTGLADLASVAIENAHLYRKAEQMARMQERERLAHDLHDTVAQLFYSIGMEAAQGLEELSAERPPLGQLEAIGHMAALGSMEVRSAIFALANDLRQEDLRYVLQTLVEEFQEATGIEACLVLPPGLAVAEGRARNAAARVVQEGLSNVRKHAQATMVLVNLASSDRLLTVTLQDNGSGIPPARLAGVMHGRGYHAGLLTLSRMLERIGGRLSLANGEEGGLLLRAEIPLPDAGDEDR
ncbi:MAG TPA: GAF domain-containing protein [Anaerolineae bacterium]|nr:GAF domain-containing protein [Anaerolineae bacterium]HPL28586.1 GAF domain-containing protein [Anaerolineae bacterium]